MTSPTVAKVYLLRFALLHNDAASSLALIFGPRFFLQNPCFFSGAEGIRTPDLRRAKAALSQLSYGPDLALCGEFTAVAQRGLRRGSRSVVCRITYSRKTGPGESRLRPALTEGLCEI